MCWRRVDILDVRVTRIATVLNLWRLRILQQLDALKTMSAVAEAVGLTRPAVSQQLVKLENEVGVTLVIRDGRGVRLTVAGRRLVDHANRMFSIEAEAEAELASVRGGLAGSLRLAGFGTAISGLLPQVVESIHRESPLLDLGVDEMSPIESLTALSARKVDLALVDDFAFPTARLSAGVDLEEIYLDPVYVVLRSDHASAGSREMSLGQLRGELWVLNEGSAGWNRVIMTALRASGFEPRLVEGGRSYSSSLALVAGGVGVTMQPGLAMRSPISGLAWIRVRPRLNRRLFAAYRSGSNSQPLIDLALRNLRAAAQKLRAERDSSSARRTGRDVNGQAP